MRLHLLTGAAVAAAILLLAAGGPWLLRKTGSHTRLGVPTARSDQRSVTLEIGGMTCEGCAKAVRSQIAAVAGVSAVEVRLDQRRAYVVCDPAVSDAALMAAVERPGAAYLATVVPR